ncbi:hypothetical protein ISCGN_012581 [Ixodes scapularis]
MVKRGREPQISLAVPATTQSAEVQELRNTCAFLKAELDRLKNMPIHHHNNVIRVLQWNCNGLSKRAAELRAKFHDKPEEKPDVILLQETNTRTISFFGFNVYSCPSITSLRPGQRDDPPGKSLVYVRSDWAEQHQIDLGNYCTERQEVVAVRVRVHQGVNVVFTSSYYRPNRSNKEKLDHGWIGHLHALYPRDQKLYGGDFNMQHHLWGYDHNTHCAESFIGEMQAHRIQLVNKPGIKTRIGDARSKDTTPDLTWTSNPHSQYHKWKCLRDSWGSDHCPIYFEFSPTRNVKIGKKRIARTINWDKFRQELEQGDSSAAASFEGFLHSALKEATTETRVEQDAPTPDLRLLGLWAKRLQTIQRYRNGLRTPYSRRAITRATVEARIYAKQLDSSRWLDFSASLSEKTSVKRLWAVSRTLLGKRKEKGATSAMALKINKTDEQLANMAGDLFFPQPDSASDIPSPYDMEILAPDDGLDRPFTLGELEWALHKGKSSTAPGPDRVTMTMLKNLPDSTKLQLLELVVWITGMLPEHWKYSLVIPVPKPGKDKGTLSNFRPISLTSCTCKVMERMVLSRIDWHLEKTGASHPVQTGFRSCLGTQESLTLISDDVIHNVHRSKFRTIVAIDVKKAFDSVPHSTIIGEAHRLGLSGRTLNFIKNFLAGRTFSVRCGQHDSEPQPNRVGVPQESVLSPTLFNLAMANLPHELSKIPGLGFTVYADDVSIWTYKEDLKVQQMVLQAGLDTIEAHLARVGMRAAPEKTNYTVVTSPRLYNRGEDYASKLNLVLTGTRIQPSTSVKILGITIEPNGKGDIWLRNTLKQGRSALNVIPRICSARGGATQAVAKRMVKTLVVSRVCYGAIHYKITARQWKQLEALNNQAMMVITGLPRFTPLPKLKQYAQLNQIQDVVRARKDAHEARLWTTPQGRAIQSLRGITRPHLPELSGPIPPWEDLPVITSSKPQLRKKDCKQQERRVKAHIKMVESWQHCGSTVAAYTDTALLEGPITRKSAAVVFPDLELEAAEALPPGVSTKGGELAAIRLGLEIITPPGQRDDEPPHPRIDHRYDRTTRSEERALSPVDWENQEYDPAEERARIKEDIKARLEERLSEPDLPGLPSRGFGRRGQVLLTRVCDADCRVMSIDPRYPGSVHDSFAWRYSWLRSNFEQGRLIDDGRLLLGDSGYVLEPWLITPVPGFYATSTACGRFNKAHSSITFVVERGIGLLKSRFECLQRHRTLYYHPTTATVIISVCAVLHNICLSSREPEPESDCDPDEPGLESGPSSEGSVVDDERLAPAHPRVSLSDRGRALRQRLVAQFRTRHSRASPEPHASHDGSRAHQGHHQRQ